MELKKYSTWRDDIPSRGIDAGDPRENPYGRFYKVCKRSRRKLLPDVLSQRGDG